jgi:hypothetical protein
MEFGDTADLEICATGRQVMSGGDGDFRSEISKWEGVVDCGYFKSCGDE